MMDFMVWVWLGIFIVTLIIESITQDLIAVWFSLGSIVALIFSAIPPIEWYVEMIIFAGVSFLSLGMTRPVVKKLLSNQMRYTNLDEFIGKKVKVISDISKFEDGEVKIHDIIYHASLTEEDESPIYKDEIVEIKTLKGNKVIVKKIKN